ncbi:MAG: hypothetical protein KGZ85_09660 [Ignavibacterium sp.]|jgi:hypothetical protein|nr:hypothetical protein [Ignavibacterium sp.]
MFGFVNINRKKEPKEFDIRKDQKRKRLILNIVFAVFGLGLLNIILYALTRV